MTRAHVSVVIPLYQSERTIVATLRSVMRQTFTDFEVLVVNDGSTDGGAALAAAFGDSRIRIITQENRGLAGARNTGIREAQGTYVAFLDADDLWHPDKLARHVAVLDARSDVGLTYSASRLIDDADADLGLVQWPQRAEARPADVFCRNPIGNGSAPVLRRAALESVEFWDSTFGRRCWFDESFRQSEDIECWTRLAVTTNWQFALVPYVLTDYRISDHGLSANTDRQLETWRRFRAKVKSYAPKLDETHGDIAEAFQLRYLARRAIKGGEGGKALRLMQQSLSLAPDIIAIEPGRTLITGAAAVVLALLPRNFMQRAILWLASSQRSQRHSPA